MIARIRVYFGPAIFILFGLAIMKMGFGSMYLNHLYRNYGIQTHGTIIDSGRSGTTRSVNWVRYSFNTPETKGLAGSCSGYYLQKGETVRIEYLSYDPKINRVEGAGTQNERIFFPVGILGLFFLIVGNHWGWRIFRQKRLWIRLRSGGTPVEGAIVSALSQIRYEYHDLDGKKHLGAIVVGNSYMRDPNLKTGAKISILYDPARPSISIWADEF